MDQLHSKMDDLVFETRNKEYGAFYLRQVYPNHIKVAMLVAGVAFLMATGLPVIYKKYYAEKQVSKKEEIVEVDLSTIEIPPLDPTLPPPPPPPPPPKIERPKIKTVKVVPPKVVPDEEVVVEELPPTQEEIKEAVISNVTQEGEVDTLGLNELADNNTSGGVVGGTAESEFFIPGVGVNAEFPGGHDAIYQYLQKKLSRAMNKASRLGDRGSVVVAFIIERDGSVSNVKVLRGLHLCESCNADAVEAIKGMKWMPAKNNGIAVRQHMTLPIRFDFED